METSDDLATRLRQAAEHRLDMASVHDDSDLDYYHSRLMDAACLSIASQATILKATQQDRDEYRRQLVDGRSLFLRLTSQRDKWKALCQKYREWLKARPYDPTSDDEDRPIDGQLTGN